MGGIASTLRFVQRNWESSWILLLLLSLTTASTVLFVSISMQIMREECRAPGSGDAAADGAAKTPRTSGTGSGVTSGMTSGRGANHGTSSATLAPTQLPPTLGKFSSFAQKESVHALSRQPRVELNSLALQPRDNLESIIIHTPRASERSRAQQESLTSKSKVANDKLRAAMQEEQYRHRHKLDALEREVGQGPHSASASHPLAAASRPRPR